MSFLKNLFKYIYKFFLIIIFKFVYGKVLLCKENNSNKELKIKKIKIDKIFYKIFKINNCRYFTTSVHDAAVIVDNKIIKEASFQLRVKSKDKFLARNNSSISNNVVLKIGTPSIIKKFNGNIFSLLSGGAAKNNYFHWLYEVLPKFELLKKSGYYNKIDFFLLPNFKESYQIET